MIEHLIINPHILLSFVSFVIGFVLLALAPIHYMIRTKTLLLNPFRFPKYDRFERRILLLGVVLAFLGIVGGAILTE
jgi:hypothetical protein